MKSLVTFSCLTWSQFKRVSMYFGRSWAKNSPFTGEWTHLFINLQVAKQETDYVSVVLGVACWVSIPMRQWMQQQENLSQFGVRCKQRKRMIMKLAVRRLKTFLVMKFSNCHVQAARSCTVNGIIRNGYDRAFSLFKNAGVDTDAAWDAPAMLTSDGQQSHKLISPTWP